MHPAIPHLVDLQQLDQQIAALRAEFDGLPKRFREADAKLNGAKSAVASAKEAHTHAQTQRKKLELDVEQWKERAKKYRGQSSSVKTNEAYKALQQEIANAEREAAKLEDLVLEQMMAVEDVEHRVKHAEADLKESETAVAAEKKQIELQYHEEKEAGDGHCGTRPTRRKGAGRLVGTVHPDLPQAPGCGDGGGPRRPVPWLRHARAPARRSGSSNGNQRRGFSLRNLWLRSLHPGTHSPRGAGCGCGCCIR